MADMQQVKMTKDWIVKGDKWLKNKTYPAEPREVTILVDQEKVAKLVKDNATT